jgi:hypothetical protein
MRLEGVEQYRRMMAVLAPKQERAVWRGALRGVGQTVIRGNVTKRARALGGRFARMKRSDIKVRVSVTNARASVEIGAKRRTALSAMGHWFEKGTSPHRVPSGGLSARPMPVGPGQFARHAQNPGMLPRPWLEPGMRDSARGVADELARRMVTEMQRVKAKVPATR